MRVMCRRYALKCIDLTGQVRLVVDADIQFPSHFNIAPSSTNPVIVAAPGGARLAMLEWGLIPHGARDLRGTPRPANARAEGLAGRPIFSYLLADRRCIVPATGFYEWKHEGSRKTPFYICRKDREPLLFAGLYDTWQDPDAGPRRTYAIVTTAANAEISPVHDRMPAILDGEGVQRWLSPGSIPANERDALLAPAAPGILEVYPVSPRVNSPSADDERLTLPVRGLG